MSDATTALAAAQAAAASSTTASEAADFAVEKAIEVNADKVAASGFADAALSSAADADSSADLAAVSEASAASSAATASTKAGEAAASAAHADDMAGATEAVAVSNDTIIAGRINDPASATSGALSATFAAALHVRPGKAGVVGNGVADDTAAIQAILNSVSPALGVVNVLIHSGTYKINGVNTAKPAHNQRWIEAGLQPKTGSRIVMESGATLSLIANTSPAYSIIYLGPTVSDVEIRGGRIEGDRATHDYTTDTSYPTHEWGYGIGVRGADNWLVEGVTVVDTTGDCIFGGAVGTIPGGDYDPIINGRIIRCTLSGARRNNISVEACDGFVIHDCDIDNAGVNDGIHDGTAPRCGIDIEGYGVGAVDYQKTLNVTITDNRVFGCQNTAIMAFNAYGCTITGNKTDQTISFGASTDVVVSGNVVKTTATKTTYGIASNASISYRADCEVTGNIVKGPFAIGIQVQRDGAQVSGNYVTGYTTYGISVNGVTDVSVIGNHITGQVAGDTNAAAVNLVGATGTSIKGNVVKNTRRGVRFQTASTGIKITGNDFRACYLGVDVAGVSEVNIKGNTFDMSGWSEGESYAVTYTNGGAKVVIEGNTFRSSPGAAINATNTAGTGQSRIIDNNFLDHAGLYAVLCTNGQHEITRNTFVVNRTSGSPYAVFATTTTALILMGNVGYNSGTTKYSWIANGTPANSRAMGNTFVATTTTPVNGDTGTVIVGGNTMAA